MVRAPWTPMPRRQKRKRRRPKRRRRRKRNVQGLISAGGVSRKSWLKSVWIPLLTSQQARRATTCANGCVPAGICLYFTAAAACTAWHASWIHAYRLLLFTGCPDYGSRGLTLPRRCVFPRYRLPGRLSLQTTEGYFPDQNLPLQHQQQWRYLLGHFKGNTSHLEQVLWCTPNSYHGWPPCLPCTPSRTNGLLPWAYLRSWFHCVHCSMMQTRTILWLEALPKNS